MTILGPSRKRRNRWPNAVRPGRARAGRQRSGGLRNPQAIFRPRHEHVGLHGQLRGLDDVFRHRHPDQERAGPERNRVRPAGGDAGADRIPDPPAARHPHRSLSAAGSSSSSRWSWWRSRPTAWLLRPSIGTTSCSVCSSAWPAARSRSASPTPRPGSRKRSREPPWGSSAPATPDRPSRTSPHP